MYFSGDPVSSIYPDCVKHAIELFRPEGIAELGIAIVGGNDTPIRNILVQTIIPGSLVAEDGRIHPNDIIIEVGPVFSQTFSCVIAIWIVIICLVMEFDTVLHISVFKGYKHDIFS